jgi:hypothetical protein
LGAVLALIGAVGGCIVISDLVSGAERREATSGALAFLVGLGALVVIVIAFLFAPVVILIAALLAWVGVARHRRAQKKHAGLRVLR